MLFRTTIELIDTSYKLLIWVKVLPRCTIYKLWLVSPKLLFSNVGTNIFCPTKIKLGLLISFI